MLSKDNSLEIKGVAILCMIFFHLFGFPERIPTENISQWMGSPITKAFQICVPIYLFMAGYGLQCIAIKKAIITLNDIWKRLKKLYLFFWWVAIPFILIGICVHYYSIFPLDNLVLNLIGMKSSFNGEWWFYYLYVELLLAFYFISKLNVKRNTYIFIMLFILIMTRFLNSILPHENILVLRHIKMILINLNIFMLGCFFAKYDVFRSMSVFCNGIINKNYIWPILLILPILVRAYLPMIGITELIMVPIFIYGIVNLCKMTGGGIFSFLGKHSMNLWLIHSFFIYYYLKHITYITHNPFIMFMTVIGCGLCCSLLIEKLKHKFLNI